MVYGFFTHDGIQINPGRINAFAPHVIPFVQHAVQNLDSQMGHADFIDVGKAHGKPDLNICFVFYDRIDFIANVAGGFFHLHQNFII